MAGTYRYAMDQKDIVRFLVTTVGSFIQDRLIDREQRIQHKDQCAERLAAEDRSGDKDTEVRYSDQAILANLDWGIDALEEAINTSNMETKHARLDHAEKMLQVCAMLQSNHTTAGIPNFYLSAWAHLNLSYLWKLRNDVHKSVLHILEMFITDPFFSRIDFAPELWKKMFLPHMSSVVGWYTESRHKLLMDAIPDSSDLSFTADLDQFFNESLIFTVRPDQAEKVKNLEQLYGESLDENTRIYARYYKDCMNFDPASSKKAMPMFPIAEAPMTPTHEVSRSIPDYVKFGPILPKSAGFSPVLRTKDQANESSRSCLTTTSFKNVNKYSKWDPQEVIPEENEGDSDYDISDVRMGSEVKSESLTSFGFRSTNSNDDSERKVRPTRMKNEVHSPKVLSSLGSPRTPSPKISSPKSKSDHKKESPPLLRLVSCRVRDSPASGSLPASPSSYQDTSIRSPDLDGEGMEMQRSDSKICSPVPSIRNESLKYQTLENSSASEPDEGSHSHHSLTLSGKLTPRSRAPKDFVCPITSQIFNDPVTLETGQTYERKAIQEWIGRGNTTCPITRQPLSADTLPKTNYVLKRLITSWKEQHPDIANELSYTETPRSSTSISASKETGRGTNLSRSYILLKQKNGDDRINQRSQRFALPTVSTSPTSVISHAAVETIINGLKPHVASLCTSMDLEKCEEAVVEIARVWKDTKGDSSIHSYLSDPTTVNGFVEILSASMSREVLKKSIYILSELILADETVGQTLTSVDSDFYCLTALLKNGLAVAAILIYQLGPSYSQLCGHDLIPPLVHLILAKNEENSEFQLVMDPKDAAILLIEQILMGGDETSRTLTATTVLSENGLPALITMMDRVEGRQSLVSILMCCIHADKNCRNLIAEKIELSLVLELFHDGTDMAKDTCIEFFSELVQLSRRSLCNNVLKAIKEEGAFSTMHTFLVYLQMAPMEQQHIIASLLLQLDLLVEPRKMSIYREESIEALIEALRRKEFPNSQFMALDALLSVSGRVTASGQSFVEAWLLHLGGFDQPLNALMKADRQSICNSELIETMEAEDKDAAAWEKRVAFVLCNHEKGSIFKALEECFRSNSLEIAHACLVVATWLTHMLYKLPDTHVRDVARASLLDQFINVLQSSKNLEERILAAVALKSFIADQGGLNQLGVYARRINSTLRKLKKYSVVATDLLKALMNLPSVDATEFWSCTEVDELDLCSSGEVLSLIYRKGRVLSSHSDGTIKLWDARKKALRLVQENRQHTKAVTCLCTSSSGEKLYSGSLDKTIRVWAILPDEIQCLEVHDVREAVLELSASSKIACFASPATGVKLYNWTGVPKHVNFNKNVKSLAMTGDKLYCGCTGYSIQEVDLAKSTSNIFYSGTRKLLGKQTIQSLQIHSSLLFAGGSSVDNVAGKVFSLASQATVGSLSTGHDIHCITISSDFIFAATGKSGVIEVWLKERVERVASIKSGSSGHGRITSLAADSDGEMLYAGTSDGKIQAWALG